MGWKKRRAMQEMPPEDQKIDDLAHLTPDEIRAHMRGFPKMKPKARREFDDAIKAARLRIADAAALKASAPYQPPARAFPPPAALRISTANQSTARAFQPNAQAAPALQPDAQAAPALQPDAHAAPALQPDAQAAPALQPDAQAAPALQPDAQAAPALQPDAQAALQPDAPALQPDQAVDDANLDYEPLEARKD